MRAACCWLSQSTKSSAAEPRRPAPVPPAAGEVPPAAGEEDRARAAMRLCRERVRVRMLWPVFRARVASGVRRNGIHAALGSQPSTRAARAGSIDPDERGVTPSCCGMVRLQRRRACFARMRRVASASHFPVRPVATHAAGVRPRRSRHGACQRIRFCARPPRPTWRRRHGLPPSSFPHAACFSHKSRCLQLKTSTRSERVKCIDFHPTKPWLLTALFSGEVTIFDYSRAASAAAAGGGPTVPMEVVRTITVKAGTPCRSAKFIARMGWVRSRGGGRAAVGCRS